MAKASPAGTDTDPAAQLRQNGYIYLKDVLSEQVLADLASLSRKTLAACSAEARDKVRSNGSMVNLAREPDYARIIASPEIYKIFHDLDMADVRWTGGYLISKPPGGPPLFWHQDWWGWDHPLSYADAPVQLFVMIYLTQTQPENGCLRVIPGSHRRAHPLHRVADAHSKALAAITNPADEAFTAHTDEVALPVMPGDVLVGDSRLLHGAYANQSGAERPLLTLWYAPDFAALPPEIRARYVKMMREQDGDVQESTDSTLTPYNWPEAVRGLMEGCLPDYDADAAPLEWNRSPDVTQMQQ